MSKNQHNLKKEVNVESRLESGVKADTSPKNETFLQQKGQNTEIINNNNNSLSQYFHVMYEDVKFYISRPSETFQNVTAFIATPFIKLHNILNKHEHSYGKILNI